MESLAGSRLGRFHIRRLIGKGGMGEVYAAMDENLDREVAVKVLGSEVNAEPHRRRFMREAKLAARLTHPNIASIHEVGESDGRLYIVMELLEGETLRNLITLRKLPLEECLAIGRDVARALARAHTGEVIHRDIKPENILITHPSPDTMVAKVLDFGLARDEVARKRADGETTATDLTGPGEACGTAGYLAPEQARGLAVDVRADIFSFGAVLYEMLTGKRAFDGKNQLTRMLAVVKTEPPPIKLEIPDIPADIDALVRKCLSKRPDDRFANGGELLTALEEQLRNSQRIPAAQPSGELQIVSDLDRPSDPRPSEPRPSDSRPSDRRSSDPSSSPHPSSSHSLLEGGSSGTSKPVSTPTPAPVARDKKPWQFWKSWKSTQDAPVALFGVALALMVLGIVLIIVTIATRPGHPPAALATATPKPRAPVVAAARSADDTPRTLGGAASPAPAPAPVPDPAPAPEPEDPVTTNTPGGTPSKPRHSTKGFTNPRSLPAPSVTPSASAAPPIASAPPPAAVPTTGTIRIQQSQDSVMTVVLDGDHRRVKDGILIVPCGRHRIRVGFKEERLIEVPCGGTFNL